MDNYDVESKIIDKIEEMEADDYEFPKRMSKKDFIIIGIVLIVNLICLIVGYHM